MSDNLIVSIIEGIEPVAPFLDALPEDSYSLYHANGENCIEVIERLLPNLQENNDRAFVVLLPKELYFEEEQNREISSLIARSGIKAEPVFVVVSEDLDCEEVNRIVSHNNVFFMLPNGEDGGSKNICGFKGYVDKALLDFRQNRKIVGMISSDIMSFMENETLRCNNEEVEKINKELESINKIDELTQLLNRKGIMESFEMLKGRATRERWRLHAQNDSMPPQKTPVEQDYLPDGGIEDFFGHLSCIMIDIDNFKLVNDTYGHLIGDQVLRELGKTCYSKDIFRKEDVCGRFGGEEFIIILPATSSRHALVPAEKLRKTFKKKVFRLPDGNSFRVTVSLGVAQMEESEESIQDIIHKADIALYHAKETGKDRSIVYDKAVMGNTVTRK